MPLNGARLRSLRESRDLEPGQLAYKARISKSYVYLLEANERPNVAGVILERIARALDTTVDYLLGLSDDPVRPEAGASTIPAGLRLKMQRVAEGMAALPEDSQRRIIDAMLLLLDVQDALHEDAHLGIEETDLLPEPDEGD